MPGPIFNGKEGGSGSSGLPKWAYASGGSTTPTTGIFTDDGGSGGPGGTDKLFFNSVALNALGQNTGITLFQNVLDQINNAGSDTLGQVIILTTETAVIQYVFEAISVSGSVITLFVGVLANETYPASFPAGNYSLSFGPNTQLVATNLAESISVTPGNIPVYLTADGLQIIDSTVSLGTMTGATLTPLWSNFISAMDDTGSIVTGTFAISGSLGGSITVYNGLITDITPAT